FSFTASAGERFAWDDLQSPGSASFRLIDPFGRDATGAIAFNDQTFTTEFTGTYYLLAEGRVSDTAAERAYRFALHRTVDPAPTTINLGDTYVATIVRPTEQIRYDLTLTEPSRIYVDSKTPDTNINWTLAS